MSAQQLPAPARTPATPNRGAPGRDQTTGTDHDDTDTHDACVGPGPTSAPAATIDDATPNDAASRRDADLLLYLFADQLNDVEDMRKRTANRLRSLFSTEEWGKGVPTDLPEAQALTSQLEQIKAVEQGITLSLKRAMRVHYLGPWQKRTVGVGEKQLGRLLAAIGDPGEREKPSQLWAYCGLHVLHPGHFPIDTHARDAGVDPTSDPGQCPPDTHTRHAGVAASRQRGQKANWSTDAKMRVYLIAESCIKQRTSPYRPVYDDGRAKYAEALHAHPCKRCGPSGHPAQPGSSLSDGHKHARAMRLVMKRILLDLWKEAQREVSA